MYFVLDVETNGVGGFRPPRQRIMQLAYGKWDREAARELEVTSVLVSGAGELAPRAFAVHGIPLETCETQGVPLAEAVRAMCRELEPCVAVVGHNVEFDIGCLLNQLETDGLYTELLELERLTRAKPWICTMRQGTDLCKLPKRFPSAPGTAAGYKFPTLAELHTRLFGEPPNCRLHDAAADCRVTAKCLDAMEDLKRSQA